MRVRITSGARYSTVRLFAGMEFVKSEWRPVPAQYENEAMTSGWLEIEPVPAPVLPPAPIEPEPDPEPEPIEPEPEPEPVKKSKKPKGGQ